MSCQLKNPWPYFIAWLSLRHLITATTSEAGTLQGRRRWSTFNTFMFFLSLKWIFPWRTCDKIQMRSPVLHWHGSLANLHNPFSSSSSSWVRRRTWEKGQAVEGTLISQTRAAWDSTAPWTWTSKVCCHRVQKSDCATGTAKDSQRGKRKAEAGLAPWGMLKWLQVPACSCYSVEKNWHHVPHGRACLYQSILGGTGEIF